MTEPTPRCRDGRCVRMCPGLCGPCADRVAGWLGDLPALVARVAAPDPAVCCDKHAGQPLGAGAVPCPATGARVSGTSSTPLPGGADRLSWLGMAADVRHRTADCPACRHWTPVGPNLQCLDAEQQGGAVPVGPALASWAQLVAELLEVTPPRAGRVVTGRLGAVARTSSADVPALVAFLTRWHETIVGESWAGEYAQEIHGQWTTARALAGDTERSMRIGSCIALLTDPDGEVYYCDEPLYAQPSDQVIRCRGCGADWTRELWLILGAAIEGAKA